MVANLIHTSLFFSSPSLPMHPYFPQAIIDGPYAPSLPITKIVVSTASVNKLTAPVSQCVQPNESSPEEKETAEIRQELAARKKVALERLPILTDYRREYNT